MIALENGTNRPLKAAGGCWTTKLRAKRPKEVQTAAQFSRTLLERTRSCAQRIKPMIGIDPSIDRSTNQPINQSTNQPINPSTNQIINQSTNQPINQSTNHISFGTSSHAISKLKKMPEIPKPTTARASRRLNTAKRTS